MLRCTTFSWRTNQNNPACLPWSSFRNGLVDHDDVERTLRGGVPQRPRRHGEGAEREGDEEADEKGPAHSEPCEHGAPSSAARRAR